MIIHCRISLNVHFPSVSPLLIPSAPSNVAGHTYMAPTMVSPPHPPAPSLQLGRDSDKRKSTTVNTVDINSPKRRKVLSTPRGLVKKPKMSANTGAGEIHSSKTMVGRAGPHFAVQKESIGQGSGLRFSEKSKIAKKPMVGLGVEDIVVGKGGEAKLKHRVVALGQFGRKGEEPSTDLDELVCHFFALRMRRAHPNFGFKMDFVVGDHTVHAGKSALTVRYLFCRS